LLILTAAHVVIFWFIGIIRSYHIHFMNFHKDCLTLVVK